MMYSDNDLDINAVGLVCEDDNEDRRKSVTEPSVAPSDWYSSSLRSSPSSLRETISPSLSHRPATSPRLSQQAATSPRLSQRAATSPPLPQLLKNSRRGRRTQTEGGRKWLGLTKLDTLQGPSTDHPPSPKRSEDGPLSPRIGDHIGDYAIVRMIGQGGEGSIYLVVHRESNKDNEVVLKRRLFNNFTDGNEGLREVLAMAKIRSPYCVALANVFQVEQNAGAFALCLVMEYCQNGDLLKKIVRIMDGKETLLAPNQVKMILLDILSGLEAIHSAGFTHRDIKLENILLDKNDRAKIADLGLAYPSLQNLAGRVGSFYYSSPEMEVDRHGFYSSAVDVWAVGVIAFELSAGYVWASKNQSTSLGMIAARDKEFDVSMLINSEFGVEMRREVGPLVMMMLQRNPQRRPDCNALIRNPLFG